jgi:alpha-tubulin suppressor-like RCC1 family protein
VGIYPSPVRVGTDSDWQAIRLGKVHGCGLRTGGHMVCWGQDTSSELGDGLTANVGWPPVDLGTGWTAVGPGHEHTCALYGGTIRCTGRDGYGQQGNGATTVAQTTFLPATTSFTDFSAVDSGEYVSCALRAGGLYCWGNGTDGRTAMGFTGNTNTPSQYNTDTDWQTLYMGARTGCAIKTGGALFCWGKNGSGQVGVNSAATMFSYPVEVWTSGPWTDAAPGEWSTCGIKTDGSLWCWGWNQYGEVGDGTYARAYPSAVAFP